MSAWVSVGMTFDDRVLAQAVPLQLEGSNPAAVPAQITFAPLSPACPLPPVSSTEWIAAQLGSFTSFGEVIVVNPGQVGEGGLEQSNEQTVVPPILLDPAIVDLIAQGQLESALERAADVQNLSERASYLRSIVYAYLERGQLQQAEAVALTMPDTPILGGQLSDWFPSNRDAALLSIYSFYLKAGQLDAALAIVSQVREANTRISSWFELAELYQQQGQSDKALTVLDRAATDYQQGEALVPSGIPLSVADVTRFGTHTIFVQLYEAAGKPEGAAALAEEMLSIAQTFPKQNFLSLSALTSAANALRAANEKEQANTVRAFVLQNVDSLEGPAAKAIILARIARLDQNSGETDRAQEALAQAQEFADAAIDPDMRNVTAITLVQAYSSLGQYDNASRIAESIEPLALRQQVQEAIRCAQSNPSQ